MKKWEKSTSANILITTMPLKGDFLETPLRGIATS
jgi:hypothetical protein